MKNLFLVLVLFIACPAVYAAELFGKVDAMSGSAFVSDQSGQSTPVAVGLEIHEGQTISSGPDSEVHIVTEDGGMIAMRPDTVFRVDEYKADGSSADKIFMSLLTGAVRSITGWIGKHDNSAYRLTTPTVTLGIRGTDHEVTVIDKGNGDEPGTYDTVNEGATVMKTPQGQTEVAPGKFAFAPKGRVAAPLLLARQPGFWARRRLKIEGRIQQRKEYLRGRFEQMREERIKRLGSAANRRHGNMHEERGEQIRQHRQENHERRRKATQNENNQEDGGSHHHNRERRKHARQEEEKPK
jgi:hypothetical protein